MEDADGHRYFEGLAVAHVLGGLDDSEGRVFRAHLLDCGSCRARVGELRAIAHDLADVERDERRVRAAQAIDTKRREAEEDEDSPPEPVASPRSSRITVVVGLVLIIGLSLWNFTLRGALTVQETHNETLVEMGVIAHSGQQWEEAQSTPSVDGTVKSDQGKFLVILEGLDDDQRYGLYVQTAEGTVLAQEELDPTDGLVYRIYALPDSAAKVTVTDPADAEDGTVGRPADTPTGVRIIEALRPTG